MSWFLTILLLPVATRKRAVSPSSEVPVTGPLPDGRGGLASIAVFVHPACGCTPKTLDLLEAMVEASADLAVTVFLTLPNAQDGVTLPHVEQDLTRGGLFVVRQDLGGLSARALGAERSGHALVMDSSGQVVFSGGVLEVAHGRTLAELAATALEQVEHLVQSNSEAVQAPVQGCPLVFKGEATQ